MAFLDAELNALGDAAVRFLSDRIKRIRPVESKVSGRTVLNLTANVRTIEGIVFARSGRIREYGWATAAAGDHALAVESTADVAVGDLIDPQEGDYDGDQFRVTYVDKGANLCALELVPAN